MTTIRSKDHGPAARTATMTGPEMIERLYAQGWNKADYARLNGLSRQTVDNKAAGRGISIQDELIVEYIERHSMELLARPEVQTPVRATPARRAARYHMEDRELLGRPRERVESE